MSVAEGLEFFDTNVLIYAYDDSAGIKHERAKELIQRHWQANTGCLSIQVLQEFYVNITRKVKRPLAPEAAAQIISDMAVWRIHSPNTHDIVAAIHLQQRYQLSFWDAMVVNSALQLGCRTLWSEDLNPGQVYDQVTVQNPF
jgi:predicted nucleic acid-binding protein